MEVHNLLHYARELLSANTHYQVENLDITKAKYSSEEIDYLQSKARFNHRAQQEFNRLVTGVLDQTIVEYERILKRGLKTKKTITTTDDDKTTNLTLADPIFKEILPR